MYYTPATQITTDDDGNEWMQLQEAELAYWAWVEKLEAAYGPQAKADALALTRSGPMSTDQQTWLGEEELPF
jgi:hypothetical protein